MLNTTHDASLSVVVAGSLLAAALIFLSKTFRYVLKYTLYFGGVSMIAVFLIPVFAFRPKNVLNLV